jgi:hypothetical protein
LPKIEELVKNGSTDFYVDLVDPKGVAEAYPISTFTYLAFNPSRLDCDSLFDVLFLVFWAWTNAEASSLAIEKSLAPINDDVRSACLTALLSVKCESKILMTKVQLAFGLGCTSGVCTHFLHAHAHDATAFARCQDSSTVSRVEGFFNAPLVSQASTAKTLQKLAKLVSQVRGSDSRNNPESLKEGAIGSFSSTAAQPSCLQCDVLGDFFQESTAQTFCVLCPRHTRRYLGILSAANRTACQCKEGVAESQTAQRLFYA